MIVTVVRVVALVAIMAPVMAATVALEAAAAAAAAVGTGAMECRPMLPYQVGEVHDGGVVARRHSVVIAL